MTILSSNHALLHLHQDLKRLAQDSQPEASDPGNPGPFSAETDIAACQNYYARVPANAKGVVVILGMGTGHGLADFIKNRPEIFRFHIFELSQDTAKTALQTTDLSGLLSDSRVRFCIGEEPHLEKALGESANLFRLETTFLLEHAPSLAQNPASYQKLRGDIFAYANGLNVGGATLATHGPKFMKNRLESLYSFDTSPLMEDIKDAFSGIPAILVAGGPSLTEALPLLKEVQGKAVLFSVDSALPILARHGIRPDFVSVLDYRNVTYEKIAPTAASFTNPPNLIGMTWVCAKIPKCFNYKNIFWFFTGSSFESWISKKLGGRLLTIGAGSVAHLNFLGSIVTGCSPAILVGQDLGYPTGKDHAEGVVISSADTMKRNIRNPESKVILKANDGNLIESDRSMFNLKTTFEEMIKGNPGHYINTTFRGAVIEGTEFMHLEEAVSRFCSKPVDINHLIEKSIKETKRTHIPGRLFTETDKLKKEFIRLLKGMETALPKGESSLKQVSTLLKEGKKYPSINHLPSRLKKQILDVDRLHNKADQHLDIWGFLSELTLEGLRDTEREKSAIERISEKEDYLRWLQDSLQRINRVAAVRLETTGSFLKDLQQSMEEAVHVQKAIATAEENPEAAMEIFCRTGHFRLLRSMLASQAAEKIPPPLLAYYKGRIHALEEAWEEAEASFQEAMEDSACSEKTCAFRKEWGKEYLDYATWGRQHDRKLCLRMIYKGLAMAPDHGGLRQAFKDQFLSDLRQMQVSPESEMLREWEERFTQRLDLMALIPDAEAAEFLSFAAETSIREKDYPGARSILELALSREDRPAIRIRLQEVCFDMEDYEAGFLHLDKASRMDAAMAVKWENAGSFMEKKLGFDIGLQVYEAGLAHYPDHAPFRLRMGIARLKQKNKKGALEEFKIYHEKKELPPASPDLNAVRRALQGQNAPQAFTLLETFLTYQPENPEVWDLLGTAHLLAGNAKESASAYTCAITLQPDFDAAHFNLAVLYHQTGQTEAALAAYSEALRVNPDSADTWMNLGTLLFDQKDYLRAAGYFEKAADLAEDPVIPLFNLARVMETMGNTEAARHILHGVLEKNPAFAPAIEAARRLNG